MFPACSRKKLKAVIRKDRYPLPIFRMIQEAADISEAVMYNTYNMGIGMVLALDQADADKAVEAAHDAGRRPVMLGTVEAQARRAGTGVGNQ